MGVKPDEAKLLGLPRNKREDTLAVSFKGDFVGTTSVFDPLGVASLTVLVGKKIYREACDQCLPWDAVLLEKLDKQLDNFRKSLPDEVKIPRSLAPAKEPVQAIDLHVFGDTSGTGTAATVYAVVHQDSSTNLKEGADNPKTRTRVYPYGS